MTFLVVIIEPWIDEKGRPWLVGQRRFIPVEVYRAHKALGYFARPLVRASFRGREYWAQTKVCNSIFRNIKPSDNLPTRLVAPVPDGTPPIKVTHVLRGCGCGKK